MKAPIPQSYWVLPGQLLAGSYPGTDTIQGTQQILQILVDAGIRRFINLLEPDELPADAARRELSEETGLQADEVEPLVIVVHDYAERLVRLHVFLARDAGGEVRMRPSREWGWKTLDELYALEMPEANRQILHALRWRLPDRGSTTS